VVRLQRDVTQTILSCEFLPLIDLAISCEPIPRSAGPRGSGREAGVLRPSDVRAEEGWPASTDPTTNSFEPLVAGGKPAHEGSDARSRQRQPLPMATTSPASMSTGRLPTDHCAAEQEGAGCR
jgi:hypothetical protein